jgi:predicted dehydrogenase
LFHDEAKELLELAQRKDLKLTCGHNLQFSKEQVKMREFVKNDFLGGKPVHLESIYGYNLGDENYAAALLGDKNHWVRKMPGKLFQNIISHGIAKIAEFIEPENPLVIAKGFTSPLLERIGEDEIIDELRVTIIDKNNVTGYFTFSTTVGPLQNQFRIYGPKNGIIVDHINRMTVKLKQKSYKSYLNYFLSPLIAGNQYIKNSVSNIGSFLKNDFHDDAGMPLLIESFYESIINNQPPPIPYSQIESVSYIMEEIIKQVFSE